MNIPEKAIALEGTPFIMLADDTELPARAKLIGTIIIETEIAELPEVKALVPGAVVVDVGAFIGDTTLIFLERGCKVFAFEPYPDAFACLEYNTNGRNIECFKYALGNGEKTVLNYEKISGNDGNRSLTIKPEGEPTVRLDDLELPKIDFLKIDVEGFELEVLAGAMKTIATDRPVILIEANDVMLVHHGKAKADVKAAIEAKGYSVRVCIHEETSDVCDYICHPL